jgi:hypothetical protein
MVVCDEPRIDVQNPCVLAIPYQPGVPLPIKLWRDIIVRYRCVMAGKTFSYQHIGRIPGRPFYEHNDVGWNFRITEFEAAVLLAQIVLKSKQSAARRIPNSSMSS